MMLSTVLRASLDGAVVVTAVWIVSRALPRLSPGARAMLWWCAAAKFVVALVWITPVPLPIMPARDAVSVNGRANPGHEAVTVTELPTPTRPVESASLRGPADLRAAAYSAGLAAWAIGLAVAIALAGRRWSRTMTAIRGASAAPLAIQRMARDLAHHLGLQIVPDVRMSTDVETPLVAGLRRPVVLLPADRFSLLAERQQRMALCHELAHVKRGDLWLGCIPALAERIFFFHPLVHVAAREYVFWREAACDAAVIDALDAAPQEYGRLLLDLGVARRHTTPAAAGASWSFLNLKRRIAMLSDPPTGRFGSRAAGIVAVGISIAAMVPVQLAARRSTVVAADTSREIQRSADRAPRTEKEPNFVLFLNERQTTMSGSTRDIQRARRFRSGSERLLWFRHDGREYVVRDPAVLDQILAIWKTVNDIGDEQGKLGSRQGELGTKQGEIGTKQGEIGTEQGKLGTRQGVLGTRQGVLATREGSRTLTAADEAAIERERQDIEREMRELDREMRALDVKMRELDQPMRELGKQMEVLGKEMEALGREMEEASRKAESEMRVLLQRAITSGAAQTVRN